MSSNLWDEKAARLLSALDHVHSALLDALEDSPKHHREVETATVARFLREEFSGDPPTDTNTMPLFPDDQSRARQ